MSQALRQSVSSTPPTSAIGESALWQRDRIRQGGLKPTDLVQLYLNRIRKHDEEIGAYTAVFEERALKQAAAVERKLSQTSMPFAGVPIAVKDICAIRGSFMRMGSRAFRYLYTPVDDRIVARLRAAGFIFLGKTTLSELGALPHSEPAAYKPVRNPWDFSVTTGGSSAGSAAAVAAGLAPLALGSDGGGSVRIPASFCGLVGFKPSRALVPYPHGPETPNLLWLCGPITRNVRDAAAMMDVLVGGWRNPLAYLLGHPPQVSTRFMSGLEAPTQKLRIRWTTQSNVANATPEIKSAVERVVRILRIQGHDVEEGPDFNACRVEAFLPLWQKLISTSPVLNWSWVEPTTRWLRDVGRTLQKGAVNALFHKSSGEILDWFGDADIWVTPTVAVPPPKMGSWSGLKPMESIERAADICAFVAPFNVTGQPGLSLPVSISRAGHPIGVQLVGRFNEDVRLLALGAQVEKELGWEEIRQSAATQMSWAKS